MINKTTIDQILMAAGLINSDLCKARHKARVEKSKIPLLPNENAQKYYEVVKYIYEDLLRRKSNLILNQTVNRSKTEFNIDEGTSKVELNNKNHKNIIWSLIHEYGHVINGCPKKSAAGSKEREESAWEKGFEKISRLYSIIQKDKKDFDDWRDDCLKTYKSN